MRVWLGVSVCLAAVAAVAAAVASAGASTGTATPPNVLVIGDSVAGGMYWQQDGIAVVQRNLDVNWDVAVCRTISGTSCPFDGERAPTLLEVVKAHEVVPPTVVVAVGYNDPAPTFATEVDEAMSALVAAGAKNVIWLTFRESRGQYPMFNTLLARAQSRWPELVLADWNGLSKNHPSWFQNDFVHLTYAGGLAMAHLVHSAIVQIYDPLHVERVPLWLHAGRSYTLRLHAGGGTPPYRWSVAGGRPPRGFHLSANGTLTTTAVRGAQPLTLSVTDADGATADVPLLTS